MIAMLRGYPVLVGAAEGAEVGGDDAGDSVGDDVAGEVVGVGVAGPWAYRPGVLARPRRRKREMGDNESFAYADSCITLYSNLSC